MTQPMPPGMNIAPVVPANMRIQSLADVDAERNAQLATKAAGAPEEAARAKPAVVLGYEQPVDPTEAAEQARLEAEHGQAETAGTQFARGALSALLAPGAILGAASEAFGALTHTKFLEDFGRDLGRASTGRSAIEALGGGYGALTADANEATSLADRARIAVDEQERAWPLLSTISQVGGGVAFGLATGSLAQGGAPLGLKGIAAVGGYEGAGAGAQAAYDADAPITDVWTSALLGGAGGTVLAGGIGAAGSALAKVKPKAALEKVFAGEEGAIGKFAEERAAKAIGVRAKHWRKMGDADVRQMTQDVLAHHLDDGTPVFPKSVMEAARMDEAEMTERLVRAKGEVGAKLGATVERASQFIDETAPQLRIRPRDIAGRIEREVVSQYKGGLAEELGAGAEGLVKKLNKMADALGEDMSIADFHRQRGLLDDLIYEEQLGGKKADALTKSRGILESEIVARIDNAADAMGDGSYRALKQQYQSLTRATKIAAEQSGERGNRLLSLTDNGWALGGLIAGDPLTAIVAGVGHKLLRERGSAIAATLLRRFAKTPASVDLAKAGGREAQEVMEAIVKTKNFIRDVGEQAGANPSVRAVGENTADDVAFRELVRRAGDFNPKAWATEEASPLARTLYRGQILDTVAKDLAETVPRSVALRPALDFELDPGKLAKLTKDADGPAAIGAVQAKVREIADARTAMDSAPSPRSAAARDIPSVDDIPHEAYFGNESFHPERVDIDRVSKLGLENTEYLREGMRPASLEAIRKVDDLSALGPARASIDPDGNVSLIDGRHRMAVAKERGETHIPVKLIQTNAAGDPVGLVTTTVPIQGQASALPALEQALQRLETADVANALVEGHNVVRGLAQAGAEADARSLALVLGDDAFGEAGKFYRQTIGAPDDMLRELADPGKLRDALRTLELRGQLSQKVADEHADTLAAWQARQKLTGEPMPPEVKSQMREIEDLWSKGEESVTLDGARFGRVVDALENMVENKVASRVPQVPQEQQVAETIKRALKHVEPALKPALRPRRGASRVRSAIAGGALTGPARLADRATHYENRLEQISQSVVAPDTEQRAAAINTAPAELRTTLAATWDGKMATLLRDLPKPSTSIHGRSFSSLSSEDIRRGNAMIDATLEPLSVFEDFARGDVDPDKVAYAWKQYPGLQKASQMGLLDMLQSQLSEEELSSLPGSTLTQLDYLLGFNGSLQETVEFSFSTRMTSVGDQLAQNQGAQPAPPSRGLQLPTSKPSLTERLAGAR